MANARGIGAGHGNRGKPDQEFRCLYVWPVGSGSFIGRNLSYAVSTADRAKQKRCQGPACLSFGICPGGSGSVSVATFYSSDQRTALFHHLQNDKN